MSTSPSGLPRFVDRHGPIIADMVDRGLRPDQIRRRFLLLNPAESPALLNELLRRVAARYSVTETAALTDLYSEVQIRVGVELAVFEASELPEDPVAACTLDEPTFTAIEQLTGLYDPSGATTRTVLGRIGAVRAAISGGHALTLTPTTYEQVRQRLASRTGLKEAPAWPVPWTEVAYRLGNGLWNCAMNSIGLQVESRGRGCGETSEPPRIPHTALDIQKLDDPGIGVIPPTLPVEEIPEESWDSLRDLIAEDLAVLPWRSQLVLKYEHTGRGQAPSAWANNGPEGVTAAVSSIMTVPEAVWPVDQAYFEEGHWQEPLSWEQPWTAGPLPPTAAAERMIDALRFGRLCTNPYSFRWGTTAPADADTTRVSTPARDGEPTHADPEGVNDNVVALHTR